MSSGERGNEKQSNDTPEDFETFMRESLAQLSEGQNKILQYITTLKPKF